MTEAEWLSSTDPQAMLTFLRDGGKLSERKARLFAVAACRRIWHLLTDERSRTAVVVAERYADGLASEEELFAASSGAGDVCLGVGDAWCAAQGDGSPHFANAFDSPADAAAYAATWTCAIDDSSVRLRRDDLDPFDFVANAVAFSLGSSSRGHQAALLHDMFGPLPPRTVAAAPAVLAWNAAAVVKIARLIYDEKEYDNMPVLADALEDAGCTNADILAHCRHRGPHVRGCWVIDNLLGKE